MHSSNKGQCFKQLFTSLLLLTHCFGPCSPLFETIVLFPLNQSNKGAVFQTIANAVKYCFEKHGDELGMQRNHEKGRERQGCQMWHKNAKIAKSGIIFKIWI